MEDRLSQQEVEHEANAVRNEHRKRRPGNRRHTAPHCACVNIAGEKKESAGKRTARQTDQGPEGPGFNVAQSRTPRITAALRQVILHRDIGLDAQNTELREFINRMTRYDGTKRNLTGLLQFR